MSETLFHDKYSERALLNSPAVKDSQEAPVYPELSDQKAMRQKASEWYGQADALTSPDEDPEHEEKIRAMGPAPTDAFGFAVDNNGERLPDRNAGMSQQERLSTLSTVKPSEVEPQNVQYAMDNHAKSKKAAYRDGVMTDLMGAQMEKDPISGVWRPPVPDYGKVFAADKVKKGEPLLSKEEIEAMPAWFDRALSQVAGGGIDAMVNIGRTMAMGAAYSLGKFGTKESREKNEKIFNQLNDPNVDSYELLGGLGQDIKIDHDGTLSGGLVRGFSQFLLPFTAALRATSAITKGHGLLRAGAAGFATDYTSSQASDGNLADLFLMLGADNDALKFMSASRASTQAEAKLKIAIEGGIIGEGIGLTMKGGGWLLTKTKDKKLLKATADFLIDLSKAARRTNEVQVAAIESDASEIISNHLLEQYDVQRAATPPTPADAPRGTAGEPGEIPVGKEGEQKPEDGAPPKPDEKKQEQQPPAPTYTPSPEVREAYAQFALAKILKDDMTPDEWMKSMKGKGNPELLKQSYTHAKKYIDNDGRAQAYYHRTERAVIETPDTKKGRTAEQWLQEIEGASQGKGQMGKLPADVRPNATDMKWLGVDTFLKENKGKKVTKDQLIEHIRSSRVEIMDIDKGAGEGAADVESDEFMEALNDAEYDRLPTRDNEPEIDPDEFESYVEQEKEYHLDENKDEWSEGFRGELEDEYTDEHGEINEEGLEDAINSAVDDRAEEYARGSAEESAPQKVTFSDPDGNFEYTAIGRDDYGWTVRDPSGDLVGNNDIYDIDGIDDLIRDHSREWDNYDSSAAHEEALENTGRSGGGTRHEDYNLEGPYLDYNEVLLTMPKLNYGTVESGHFDEENVIVHTRFNTRTDKSGAELMFIEEVQSDYAKIGRKQGFESQKLTDPEEIAKSEEARTTQINQKKMASAGLRDAKKELEELKLLKSVDEDQVLDSEINAVQERIAFLDDELETIEKGLKKTKVEVGTSQVPDAPVQKTQEWAGMAMRRLIRYAVDSGHKKIAWTTGDMQANRWSKKMGDAAKEVIWEPATGTLSTLKHDGELVKVQSGISKDKLADYVGNTGARKLNQAAIHDGTGRVPGDQMIVAEEARGYRTVYDAEIPKSVEKYVKQWKGKITRTEINVGTAMEPEWETVMAIEFPEEMVKSARGGVPLLQLTPAVMGAGAAAGQLLEVEDDKL